MKYFSICFPLRFPDDLVPPDAPPVAPPIRAPKVACEFCECQLTPHGDVLRMSDKARELNKLQDVITALKEQLAAARSEATTLTQQIAELRAQLEPAEKDDRSTFSFSR